MKQKCPTKKQGYVLSVFNADLVCLGRFPLEYAGVAINGTPDLTARLIGKTLGLAPSVRIECTDMTVVTITVKKTEVGDCNVCCN